MIRVVHPGSGSWIFTHPGSRIKKGTGSATCSCSWIRKRIPGSRIARWMRIYVRMRNIAFLINYLYISETFISNRNHTKFVDIQHSTNCEHKKIQITFVFLRIRDAYPISDFFPSLIPNPNCLHPGSRIRIKQFDYFNPHLKRNGF